MTVVRRFFRAAANPAKPAIAVPRSMIVAGSGTAGRPDAVMSPLPEKEIGVGAAGLLVGDAVPFAVADPNAPLKMPVPLKIANVLEKVGIPAALGLPNTTEFVPENVSAPLSNEATKVFITDDGTNAPDGNITYVIVPFSE